MEYESMSAIRFRTTPKGDLPHYSYIFRYQETLGTDTKNVACLWLGNILYLEIQKGNEATDIEKFQQQIEGTTACKKRTIMATKGCDQLTPNITYVIDIWFNGVKASEDVMSEGVDDCGPAKMSHIFFV